MRKDGLLPGASPRSAFDISLPASTILPRSTSR